MLELIIVLIVIGILASVAMPQYINLAEKVRAAEGDNLLGFLRSSQMRYHAQYGVYTATLTNLDVGYTTPKYFTVTVANADPIASAMRNTVQLSTGGCMSSGPARYTLSITANGVESCSPTAACAKIGR